MAIGAMLAAEAGSQIIGQALAPSAPSVPQLPGLGAAGASARKGTNRLSATLDPLAYRQLLAMMRDPNAAAYLKASKGFGTQLTGMGNRLYSSAFDPENALRRRMQQQTMDQANVLNSQYGLDSSPYGAGVAGADLRNFNIDWQNQQLQRELSAAPTIAGDWASGAAAPYEASRSIAADRMGALKDYANLSNMPIEDYLQYVGAGNQAAQTQQQAYALNQQAAGNEASNLFPFMYYGASQFGSSSPPLPSGNQVGPGFMPGG